MRGLVGDLVMPYPLADSLPSIYLDPGLYERPDMLAFRDFPQRVCSVFDAILAPIISTLDNFAAYLDPSTTPTDFVSWLAEWVGIALDENWPIDKQRALVAHAVELYRWQGTVRGVAELVELYAGVAPEIEESGGVAWSSLPGGDLPGGAEMTLTVRVRVKGNSVDESRLGAIVASAKPAHVAHVVEVLDS